MWTYRCGNLPYFRGNVSMTPPATIPHKQRPVVPDRLPKEGDIIQTGIIFANGDGSISWGSHQVIRRISSDGTVWYRPREGKVDKSPCHWRFPVESRDRIIKDLKIYANPAEGKKAIKRLLESNP